MKQIEMFAEAEETLPGPNGAMRPIGSRHNQRYRIKRPSTVAVLAELRRWMQSEMIEVRHQLRRLERQGDEDRQRTLGVVETVDLINVKLTRLSHDLSREPPPRPPTRSRPLGL